MLLDMHFRSLKRIEKKINYHLQNTNECAWGINIHSIASLKLENNSTKSSSNSPTFSSDLPMDDSAEKPQRTIVMLRDDRTRWIRTNASAADMSIPPTKVRSMTTNRTGLRCQLAGSTMSRIASSTCAIVPKKRNPEDEMSYFYSCSSYIEGSAPCSLRTIVCFAT